MEIKSCIYNVPVFQPLPDEFVERLETAMHHRHLRPGEPVVSFGEPIQSLIVVSKGMLKLSRTSKSGREQVVRELGPGQFYGEMALFTDVESEGDLSAIVDTHACVLDRSAVQEVLKQAPHLSLSLVQAIAHRLSEAERTIGDLALLDVGERLASELVRLAETGEATEDGIALEIPVPWAQMATKLGTTPESLSRRLKSLSGEGLLQVNGRRVLIPDLDALRMIYE